jgi:hypothetical protein
VEHVRVPLGVVFGALISGVVTWRSARKSVYERLETLKNIRKEWPADLEGGGTLDHSITIALAEIRRKEAGPNAPEPTTQREREADIGVERAQRRENGHSLIGIVLSITAAVVVGWLAKITGLPEAWLPVLIAVALGIVPAIGLLVARRRE